MEKSLMMRNSKINCCVVGCTNAYYNTDHSIKFYNFPNRWYDKERKNIWINNIRRLNKGDSNKTWQPKKHDKVCSAHFVGNSKSNNPNSPAYNPTVFPKEYMKYNRDPASKIKRFERLQKRLMMTPNEVNNNSPCKVETSDKVYDMEVDGDYEVCKQSITEDFSCQVDLTDFLTEPVFIFECTMNSGEASVQANVTHKGFSSLLPKKEDKCVGLDEPLHCKGFHGYKSIRGDSDLQCLVGLSLDRFLLLLSFLNNIHGNSKLYNEDRLLVFLMKMKLGISNSALGVVFQISNMTVSRIFLSVLEELVQKAKNFVFWPDRLTIDATMPKAFQENYPKCRAIIDCTEVKICQPKKVDQRIYTYSQYKSNFTAKFLVAIAPTGFVSFVSKCYGGRASDACITNSCGFLKLLEPNDVVLADKGFPGIKCKEDVVLVIPPFVHDGRLSQEEVEETYSIASVRIHVERSIQRIKIYNILQKVSNNLIPYLDDIVYMCCILTNLQPPIINEDDE